MNTSQRLAPFSAPSPAERAVAAPRGVQRDAPGIPALSAVVCPLTVRELPAALVVPSSAATWLEPDRISNPARIGPLLSLPTKSFEISLQQIPGRGATDLQRHAHEAVHYVRSGHGYSEISGTRHDWRSGDFIYTPPWTIHRHYNIDAEPAELIIIENSKLLEALGLHERESFGLISYADYLRTQKGA